MANDLRIAYSSFCTTTISIGSRSRAAVQIDWTEYWNEPSPPLLIQAGGSAAGRRLAGTRAEGVFAAELTKEGAIEHYREVKGYAAAAGRSPGDVKILPGVLLSLGGTEEEARRRSDELHDLGPTSYSVQWLSGSLGIDASVLPLDEPFPEDVLRQALDPAFAGGSIGFRQSIVKQIRATRPTVREYLKQTRYAGSGHHGFVGTPEQFADHVEDWWRSGAIDGFNLQPDVLADGLEVIADEVVPLLRRRGLFRHAPWTRPSRSRRWPRVPRAPAGWPRLPCTVTTRTTSPAASPRPTICPAGGRGWSSA
jgi:alkanesulfonate monooxygenase SsuD/methylene tetrahydromethanopterin reductase-like flavin-dependent oxidoreductase (luciferase family)